MILKPFSATLHDVLYADDSFLPLTPRDYARLLAHIPDGDSTILSLRDNLYTEWVYIENQCGTLVMERGYGGSEARKFPRGTCLFFETSVPVIKWLICNYNCCEGGDCECVEVTHKQTVSPTALVNEEWEGRVTFDGTLPINYDVTGMPDWMSAEYEQDLVRLSGTPTASGTFNVSVAATNCMGNSIVVEEVKVKVAKAAAASTSSVAANATETASVDFFQPDAMDESPTVRPRRKKA